MKDKIQEFWDEETGVARCVYSYQTPYGHIIYGIGIAECAPEDKSFQSKLTGGTIAEYRAEIDLLKNINTQIIHPGIEALKHVLCSMHHSNKYNPKSYEAIRLKKELAHLVDELEENKNAIKDLRQTLTDYINRKNDFYLKVKNN